jgi:hypothetical protein
MVCTDKTLRDRVMNMGQSYAAVKTVVCQLILVWFHGDRAFTSHAVQVLPLPWKSRWNAIKTKPHRNSGKSVTIETKCDSVTHLVRPHPHTKLCPQEGNPVTTSALKSRLSVTCPRSISWPLKMGPTGCPETSVRNYHYTLRNITEEQRSHLLVICQKYR